MHQAAHAPLAATRVVEVPPVTDYDRYRRIVVSPEVNTPAPFRGFGGFCGWPRIHALANGDLFVTFSAGYWHASWPTPLERYEPPEYAAGLYARVGDWLQSWDAPDGGRMMWTRSSDGGRSWSQPRALPTVRGAYAVGSLLQRRDGSMLAATTAQLGHGYGSSMPAEPLAFARLAANRFPMTVVVFGSRDDAATWTELSRFPAPCLFEGHCDGMLETPTGTLLMLMGGVPLPGGPGWPTQERRFVSYLLESADAGSTWQVRSVLGSERFDVEEGTLALLPDGSLATCSRCTSAWFQSRDEGRTWSDPVQINPGTGTPQRALYKKGDLLALPDGTVALLYCEPRGGSGQVIYSRDNGASWVRPAPDRGFVFDPLAYYPQATVLADGSIFAVGDHQGFANRFGPYGAEVTAMRFRIRSAAEGEGIELLPIDDLPATAAAPVQDAGAAAERADDALQPTIY